MVSVVAIIPARGGSKGVPGKNLRRVGGIPLVTRAVLAAKRSELIDTVIVSTDDAAIAAAATEAGAQVVDRPEAIAGDLATSESALIDVLDRLASDGSPEPEIVVFIQATSPYIDPAGLDAAIARVQRREEDVVFSAVETWGFLWRATETGAVGVNHDESFRPRRQDREPHFLETGAFYVMRTDGFRTAGHRFFGRVGFIEVDPRTAIEIDTAEELEVASALAPLLDAGDRHELTGIRAVVTDFDGVHTDDRVMVGADGSEYVTASRSDGMGVRFLLEAGIPVLVLSTEVNPVVTARAAKIGAEVLQGIDNKADALSAWAVRCDIPLEHIVYIGNDVNDLGCLGLVGWPVAVPGSPPSVLAAARLVLQKPGGFGAVRELSDLVLASKRQQHIETVEEQWQYQSANP